MAKIPASALKIIREQVENGATSFDSLNENAKSQLRQAGYQPPVIANTTSKRPTLDVADLINRGVFESATPKEHNNPVARALVTSAFPRPTTVSPLLTAIKNYSGSQISQAPTQGFGDIRAEKAPSTAVSSPTVTPVRTPSSLDAFKAGMADLTRIAGGAAKWLGAEETGQKWVDAGTKVADYYGGNLPQGNGLTDPDTWKYDVVRSLPSTLSLLPLAAAGALVGGGAAGLAGLGAVGTGVATVGGSAVTSRAAESLFEAGDAYQTAIDRGLSEEDASKAAGQVYVKNMGLTGMDAIELVSAFGRIPGAGKIANILSKAGKPGKVALGAGRIGVTGLMEGVEEGVQQSFQGQALGDDNRSVVSQLINPNPEVAKSMQVGAAMGLGFGGLGAVHEVAGGHGQAPEQVNPDQRWQDIVNAYKVPQGQQTPVRTFSTGTQDYNINNINSPETAVQDFTGRTEWKYPQGYLTAPGRSGGEVFTYPVSQPRTVRSGAVNLTGQSQAPAAPTTVPTTRTVAPIRQEVPPVAPVQQTPVQPGTDFTVGEKVEWTDLKGNVKPGTVFSIDGDEITVVTDKGGRVPLKPDRVHKIEQQVAPVAEPVSSSLSQTLEQKKSNEKTVDLIGMGSGIADNMYDMLWNKLQKGDTIEAGQPSAYLQVGKILYDSGHIKNREDMKSVFKRVSEIKDKYTGKEYQQALNKFINDIQGTNPEATTAPTAGEKEVTEAIPAITEKPVQENTGEATGAAQGATLADYGMSLSKTKTKNGNTAWQLTGNTKEHKDIIKRTGARWFKPHPKAKGVWTFYGVQDPTERILKNMPAREESGEVKSQEAAEAAPPEPARENHPAASKVTVMGIRAQAKAMQKTIDAKRNPAVANQNPTTRRARMVASAAAEADRLERIQTALNNLADAAEAGTLPESLHGIKFKSHIEELESQLHRSKNNREGIEKVDYQTSKQTPISEKDIEYAEFYGYVHPDQLKWIIEKVKGKKGSAKARERVSRIATYNDGRFYGDEDAGAIEALSKLAGGDKSVDENLKNFRRLRSLGVKDTDQLKRMLKDYMQYRGEVKTTPTKEQKIKAMERELIGAKFPGYFPTPRAVVERMLDEADIESGMRVLEPSAGKGNIADVIREKEPGAELEVIELQKSLRDVLEAKEFNVLSETDFLKYNPEEKYDRIIMNPPFEQGQDIDHVKHAYELLKPGGRLVSIMSEGPFFRGDKKATTFREWMDELSGISEKLLEKSFTGKDADRQTGVAARAVVINKPTATRFETGKTLTTKEKNEVLRGVKDVYREAGLNKDELKNSDVNGDPIYGYPHRPDLFVKSDITGRGLRYYITLPDGRKAHPTELFPVIAEAEVEKAILDKQEQERQEAHIAESKENRIAESKSQANYNYQQTGRKIEDSYFAKDDNGRVVRVDGKDPKDVAYYESNGFKRITEPIKADPAIASNTVDKDERNSPITESLEQVQTEDIQAMPAGTAATVPQGTRQPVLDTVRRRDIVKFLDEKLNVPIRVGRYNIRNTLGIFKVKPEVIRSRIANDLPTIAHEVGHKLDKQLKLTDPAYDAELMSLGRVTSSSRYTPDQVRKEGVAEFMRLYLTNEQAAKNLAPKYYAAFEKQMASYPDIHDALLRARQDIYTWYNQPAKARVLGVLSTRHKSQRKMSLDRLYSIGIDELSPIEKFVEDVGVKDLPIEKDPYKLAWLARGWTGKAEVLIHRGALDNNGRKIGKSLNEILKPIEKELDDFRAFAMAKHSLEVTTQGKNTGILDADAKDVIKNSPAKYQNVLDDLVKYQDAVLNQLVDAGVMDAAAVKKMRQMYPNYIPFQRVFDENPNTVTEWLSKGGYANLNNPVKAMKGSDREIIDPLESIIKNTFTFANIAEKNKVGRAIAELADMKEGLGRLVERVDGNQSGRENILKVFRNGKPEHYQLQPDLYRATLALDRESANILVKLLQYPAGWLRAGATLSPDFMVRNPIRDMFSAFINSKYGFIPVVDTMRGLFHSVKKDDLYWQWMNSGGAHSMMVSIDRDYLQNSLKQMLSKSPKDKAIAVVNPKTYLNMLRSLSEIGEEATRLGEFGKGIRSGANPLEAALASRDVTLDFSRVGSKTKSVNKAIAFFNAQIQGMDKTVRQIKANPVGTAVKILVSITLPSILLYFINRDDPRYQELPRWQKDLFWIIPTEKHLFRIPKPFELGILFGSVPERVLEYIDSQDKKSFDELGKTIWSSGMPNIIPTALLPMIEAYANYSFFTDRAIVPQREQNLEPRMQYGPYTTESAKAVGDVTNISPRKIENVFRGYTGGLGMYVVKGAEAIADATGAMDRIPRPAWTVEDVPGIKAVMTKPYESSQSINEFYDELNTLEGQYQSMKQAKTKPPEGFSMVRLRKLRKVSERLQDLRKAERKIEANESMSPDFKRQELDRLNMLMLNAVRRTQGKSELNK